MARYLTHPTARSLFGGAVIAGLIGGTLLGAFLFVARIATYPSWFQWVASGVLGTRVGFNATYFVWVGIALHYGIAIVAAIFYAYIGQVVGVLGRPIVGGTLFGIVMNAIMDFVIYVRGLGLLPHGGYEIGLGLVAHVVFFGIPVAWYIARYERLPIPYV
jgi:hypothetical protein